MYVYIYYNKNNNNNNTNTTTTTTTANNNILTVITNKFPKSWITGVYQKLM